MKRSIIILTIITLFIGTAFADYNSKEKSKETPSPVTSIKGVVLDKHTGEALVGVKVVITELDKEVYTDLDGGFEFKNVLKDEYKLEAELISYETQSLKVDAFSDNLKLMMDNK